jgi:drug/metabolite transporter (DMT)-like permease
MAEPASSRPHAPRGFVLLNVATIGWGTTFCVIQSAERAGLTAGGVTFLRFLVAALAMAPFVRLERRVVRAGLELGMWLGTGYIVQAAGLRHTSVGHAAFICTMFVVLVPMAAMLRGRRIAALVWIAALGAAAGVALLSFDGGAPNAGDAWCALCAVIWAIYITRLEHFAPQFPARTLTAVHVCAVVPWTALVAAMDGALTAPVASFPWLHVLYLGIAGSAATAWLQVIGQAEVPAPTAAIIYTLEPVWASLLAMIVFGDSFGWRGWVGAAMILGAAIATTRAPAPSEPAPAPA